MPKVTIECAVEDAMSGPTGKKRAGLKPALVSRIVLDY